MSRLQDKKLQLQGKKRILLVKALSIKEHAANAVSVNNEEMIKMNSNLKR